MKKCDEKNECIESKKTEIQDKKEDLSKESDSRSTKSTSKKPESERGRREEKRIRTWDRDHRTHSRSRSRERRRRDDVLTFAKIRVEYLYTNLPNKMISNGMHIKNGKLEFFRKNANGKDCVKESECCERKNEEGEKIWNVSEK